MMDFELELDEIVPSSTQNIDVLNKECKELTEPELIYVLDNNQSVKSEHKRKRTMTLWTTLSPTAKDRNIIKNQSCNFQFWLFDKVHTDHELKMLYAEIKLNAKEFKYAANEIEITRSPDSLNFMQMKDIIMRYLKNIQQLKNLRSN